MNNLHTVEALSSLLGARRSDTRVDAFIREFTPPPIITVDKEDDADDEFIEFKTQGFGLAFDGDVLQAIHLHSGEQDDDYAKYDLPLPMGIQFQQSKAELLSRLPPPDVTGGGCDSFIGPVPPWVRFDRVDGHSVHVEFTADTKGIRMVTVMLLKKD